MKRMCWICILVFVFVLGWTITYAGDFYVIPGMKKNFAPVPKTGQMQCYDEDGDPIGCPGTGQDGNYQKGVAWPEPRFTDNGDGTVTDKLTGLIWLQNNSGFGGAKKWTEAIAGCNALAEGQCNLTDGSSAGDWRLPNVHELHSLVDISQYAPSLPVGHHLSGNLSSYHWSSSTFAVSPDDAWTVYFTYGYVGSYSKATNSYVRCVRSGR